MSRIYPVLLAFASTVIPLFSLLDIHDQDFYPLLDIYVFRNVAFFMTKEGSVFLCRRYDLSAVDSPLVYQRFSFSCSLYSLGTGSVENVVSNISSLAMCLNVSTEASYHVLFTYRCIAVDGFSC
jgi:hypothetical protein